MIKCGINCWLGITLFLVVSIGAGCSTKITKELRDTTGKFDGSWTGEFYAASSPQTVQNWIFKCRDFSQKAPVTVADGIVTVNFQGKKFRAYINDQGVFRISVDAGRVSASSASDVTLTNPNVRVIISGNLSNTPATGQLLIGFAEVGFNGCTSKIEYTRA
ncbi:hypothetical protein AB833_20990 [Chromatiales bacterium (ex Bugula neritina AB1)]|nr:hypothetical protein AB833_20990 [Chromatiales bacterium (ex Bugula neritina AB1)]